MQQKKCTLALVTNNNLLLKKLMPINRILITPSVVIKSLNEDKFTSIIYQHEFYELAPVLNNNTTKKPIQQNMHARKKNYYIYYNNNKVSEFTRI